MSYRASWRPRHDGAKRHSLCLDFNSRRCRTNAARAPRSPVRLTGRMTRPRVIITRWGPYQAEILLGACPDAFPYGVIAMTADRRPTFDVFFYPTASRGATICLRRRSAAGFVEL